MAYYNTYSGLGVTLTKEQEKQYNTAYGIAYSYNLSAPRMEDFAAGNGEAIIDYYAQQAYAKNPNYDKTSWGSTVKKRIAEIAARNAAKTVTAVALPTTTAQQITAQVAQQAATLPPATTPRQDTKPAKTWKDYLLWIALGGVVAFGAYKMLSSKKKRR